MQGYFLHLSNSGLESNAFNPSRLFFTSIEFGIECVEVFAVDVYKRQRSGRLWKQSEGAESFPDNRRKADIGTGKGEAAVGYPGCCGKKNEKRKILRQALTERPDSFILISATRYSGKKCIFGRI